MLIVGGGNVAADRLRSVLPTDAKVTLVCPEDGMGEEVNYRVKDEGSKWGLEWRNRNFEDSDIENEVCILAITPQRRDIEYTDISYSIGTWS